MKTTLAYKVAGTLAACLAAAALSAAAQNTAAPVNPDPTAPVAAQGALAPATTPPQTPNPGTTQPQTTVEGQQAAAAAGQQTAAAGASDSAAKDFVQKAYLNNEFGIAASQVALQQAQSPSAKAAAQQVLDDGMKTRTAMITAIQGATSDMHFKQDWTDDYRQKLAQLQSTAGAAFDSKYLATQSQVTKESQGLFTDYAQTGTDASVKTFAANTLPSLQADSAKLDAAVSATPEATSSDTTTKSTATKATKKSKSTRGTR
jgi:putative membrane protein